LRKIKCAAYDEPANIFVSNDFSHFQDRFSNLSTIECSSNENCDDLLTHHGLSLLDPFQPTGVQMDDLESHLLHLPCVLHPGEVAPKDW